MFPGELTYQLLMQRLNCSYQELIDSPPWVVDDAMMVILADGRMARD